MMSIRKGGQAMNETLCGKSCEQCGWREPHQCLGCQAGPGNVDTGDCPVARCCYEKGHATCSTCGFRIDCRLLREKETMPMQRQTAWEVKVARQQWHAKHAPLLGKWLWIMFWLIIPGFIANVMKQNSILTWAPWLRIPGEILGFLCTLAGVFILWQLRNVEVRYRTAAICNLVSGAILLLLNLLPGDETSPVMMALSLVILIPAMAVSLYASYLTYHAHAAVLHGLHDELAEKWKRLWKWELGLILGLFACLLLLIISGILGLLALLVDAVGLLVVGILRLVYLYKTAQHFRDYAVAERIGLPDETTV